MEKLYVQGVLPFIFSTDEKIIRVSPSKNKKLCTDNIHLSNNMKRVGIYELPEVKSYNGLIPRRLVPFCDRKGKKGFVHYYIDDYRFDVLWKRLGYYTKLLKLLRQVGVMQIRLNIVSTVCRKTALSLLAD